MEPGECFGFKAGEGIGHQLVNKSTDLVKYLEIGDRTVGDTVEYPDDDLQATQLPNGKWALTHKNGEPF